MRNRHKISLYIFALIGVVMLIWSCNSDDDVLLSYQHTVQVGLYSTHTHKDTVLTEVEIYGIGREDSLLINEEQVGSFYLNLDMNNDETHFNFKTRSLMDNLSFYYKRKLEPVSGAGGITMEIFIDSMQNTNQFIDSVVITHKALKYKENLENVQLYIF